MLSLMGVLPNTCHGLLVLLGVPRVPLDNPLLCNLFSAPRPSCKPLPDVSGFSGTGRQFSELQGVKLGFSQIECFAG